MPRKAKRPAKRRKTKPAAKHPGKDEPSKAQREQVSIAAGGGMPVSDIACAMGMSLGELRASFAFELSTGAFRARMNLIVAQHGAGMKGNTAAAKSYLSVDPGNLAPLPKGETAPPKPEKLGKKAQANVTAQTAQVGSAWEALLPRPPVQ